MTSRSAPRPGPLPASQGDGDWPLLALTLHMLEHLAPRLFEQLGLGALQREALEQCQAVAYDFSGDADRLQAGVDAWYCRHLKGLPHPPPDGDALRRALRALAEDDQLIYAWLIGEQAARCGLDVRVDVGPRPFMHGSRLHDAYWVTHLVMLGSDYFARPLTHPDAQAWGDALTALIPWLEQNPNADLAGEVAFCLRFLRRDASAALDLLQRAPATEDPHAQATALLALSVESPDSAPDERVRYNAVAENSQGSVTSVG
ncbi:MAG: hypothetical protein Q8L48_07880 [Archangium sp.]|nr:hypothetical protein [Archangium sp.]